MTGATAQPSHEPPHKRKGTGTCPTGKTPVEKKGNNNKNNAEGEEGRKKMAERTSLAEKTQHGGKLNAPMNHMIDVASYWACGCQKTADLRH